MQETVLNSTMIASGKLVKKAFKIIISFIT